jgi:hypothetical protein
MAAPPTAPRLDFMPARFSLRTLLTLVACACFAIGWYVTATRLKEAERELQLLRSETGRLTIADRSKVHVINVAVDEPNTWRWRLFIPKGHRYTWNLAADEIPQFDVPQQAAIKAGSNEPYWERDNEVLVTARLRQEEGHWRLAVESRIGDSPHQMSGGALQIPAEKLQWNTDGASTDGRVAGSSGAEILEPKGPIILLQRRPLERRPDGTRGPSPNPMPGFMIWLQQ